jgi:hypothetical protein
MFPVVSLDTYVCSRLHVRVFINVSEHEALHVHTKHERFDHIMSTLTLHDETRPLQDVADMKRFKISTASSRCDSDNERTYTPKLVATPQES